MRLKQWGGGAVLGIALLAAIMTAILYHISKIGVGKTFGPLGGWSTILVCASIAVVGLVTVLSMPATFVLGILQLITSAKKSKSVLICAVCTCAVSSANFLFWLFYCGGIPGTAQRPFP